MYKLFSFPCLIFVITLGLIAQGCGEVRNGLAEAGVFKKRQSTWRQELPALDNDGRMPIDSRHDAVELTLRFNLHNGTSQDAAIIKEVLADREFIDQLEAIGTRFRLMEPGETYYDIQITVRAENELPANIYGNAEYWQYWHGEEVGDINLRTGLPHHIMHGVLLHEVGHLIGVRHSTYKTDIMYPYIETVFAFTEYEKNRIASFSNGFLPPAEPYVFDISRSHFQAGADGIAAISSTMRDGRPYKAGRLAVPNTSTQLTVTDVDRERGYKSVYLVAYLGLLNGEFAFIDKYTEVAVSIDGDDHIEPAAQVWGKTNRFYGIWVRAQLIGETRFSILTREWEFDPWRAFDQIDKDSAYAGDRYFSLRLASNEDGTVSVVLGH